MKITAAIFFLLLSSYVFSQKNALENIDIAIKHFNFQEYDKAIEFCNKALAIDSLFVEAYIYRAVCKSLKKNDYGGLMDLNKAISIDSSNGKAYRNRAIIKQNMGNFDGAIDDYKIAIKLDPKFAIQYTNLGLLYVEKKCSEKVCYGSQKH